MQIPSLPTDNLYKFVAIFGLVLLIVSFFGPHLKSEEWALKATEIRAQVRIYTMEQAALIEEVEQLKKGEKDLKISNERLGEMKKKRDRLEKTSIELEAKDDQLDYLTKTVFMYARINDYGWYSGVVLSCIGFGLWYAMVQRYQDAILRAQYREATKT